MSSLTQEERGQLQEYITDIYAQAELERQIRQLNRQRIEEIEHDASFTN